MSITTTDPIKRMAEIADKVENGERLTYGRWTILI